MAADELNDDIIKLEKDKTYLTNLIDSLRAAEKAEPDLEKDCNNLIAKLNRKIISINKKIDELCNFIVIVAQTEAESYDAAYRDESACYLNDYMF